MTTQKDMAEFRRAYIQLEEDGLCDAVDGAEYRRVYDEWFHYHGQRPLEEFIRDQANIHSLPDDTKRRLRRDLAENSTPPDSPPATAEQIFRNQRNEKQWAPSRPVRVPVPPLPGVVNDDDEVFSVAHNLFPKED
jgi:hypothetical protein